MDYFYEKPAAVTTFHTELAAYPAETPIRMLISLREGPTRDTHEAMFVERKQLILEFLQAAGGQLDQEFPTISALAVTGLPTIFGKLVNQPALLENINFIEEEVEFPNPKHTVYEFIKGQLFNTTE